MVKLRVPPAAIDGPPNGPVAPRVSTRRHGVAGTNRNALVAEMGFVWKFAVTEALAVIVRHPAAFSAVPVQPVNISPAAGLAVRQTVEPGA